MSPSTHGLVVSVQLDRPQLEAGVDGGFDEGDHLVGAVPHVFRGERATLEIDGAEVAMAEGEDRLRVVLLDGRLHTGIGLLELVTDGLRLVLQLGRAVPARGRDGDAKDGERDEEGPEAHASDTSGVASRCSPAVTSPEPA